MTAGKTNMKKKVDSSNSLRGESVVKPDLAEI